MQTASLGSFFLIDLLFFSHSANRTAISDADVQGHYMTSCSRAADTYTAYESHLRYNTFAREYYLFLKILAEHIYTARLSTGQLRDASDFHAWLVELSEIAEESGSLNEFFRQI
jgi:hypothetical protein